MIIVADSGSSKTDWIITVNATETVEFSTKGINPYFLNEKEITRLLLQEPEIKKYTEKASEVYFFGEGCSNPDKREMVSNALSNVFRNAFVNTENDAVGSAHATCENSKGFTCILETGSNIAFFDGEKVEYGKHGLGYVLGDEGSGAWLGKKLLYCFFFDKMDKGIRKAFKDEYSINKEVVVQNIYLKPLANKYLASFLPFLSKHRGNPFIEQLLQSGMKEFIVTHLLPYPNYKNYPCHFVGSVAWQFRDVLEETCKTFDIKVGKILLSPIRELSNYILKERVEAV